MSCVIPGFRITISLGETIPAAKPCPASRSPRTGGEPPGSARIGVSASRVCSIPLAANPSPTARATAASSATARNVSTRTTAARTR